MRRHLVRSTRARILRHRDDVMTLRQRLAQSVRARLAGKPRILTALILLVAAIGFGAVAAIAWLTYDITAGLPGRDVIRGLGEMAQSTTILDARDVAVFTIYKEQRLEVPLEKISPNLIKAVLSVEDQRFFEHSGIDVIRIGAAFLRNLHLGRRARSVPYPPGEARTIRPRDVRRQEISYGFSYKS